ncbi:phosphoglycolate phosphatase [Alkalispirochaeta americana]|uniref:phosphoglycolate phosphatase n=1 Tax=Alkalispirochaeta americana TaxID=159291 RepID=A0A1N6NA68_9SPIO|nr:HAD family hydrolase [Alkalispirochaeta americana]SIP88969.1 phosphoglycolate phosphatase [Alkalispirochaeta americana]
MKMRDVRAILFDKDGTLFDFRKTWIPVMRKVSLEAAGGNRGLSDELLRAAGYDPGTDTFLPDGPIAAGNSGDIARAWGPLVTGYSLEDLQAMIDSASSLMGPGASVAVCDLSGLFGELRRAGYPLGLATSDSEAAARATLERFDLAGFFSWIAGYDSGDAKKPDPAVVEAFARAVGVDPRSVAVVGDTWHDLAMGRNAKAALVVGVLTGALGRDKLEGGCDAVLESIADIPSLLNSRSGRDTDAITARDK